MLTSKQKARLFLQNVSNSLFLPTICILFLTLSHIEERKKFPIIFERQIPVLKVLGLNPNGITHRKYRETPINKGFLDISYKEIVVAII